MERREPVLGAPGGGADMRLTADDRPTLGVAPLARERSSGEGTRAKKGASSGAARGRATGASGSGSGGGSRGGRRRGAKRGLLTRLFYWGIVLGIWGVIGLAGLIAYEASQLPPIQNLAIPERPPTVIIEGADGKAIATRG